MTIFAFFNGDKPQGIVYLKQIIIIYLLQRNSLLNLKHGEIWCIHVLNGILENWIKFGKHNFG